MISLQDDMTAFLMNLPVAPKGLDELSPRKIARDFHAASTSSRTK